MRRRTMMIEAIATTAVLALAGCGGNAESNAPAPTGGGGGGDGAGDANAGRAATLPPVKVVAFDENRMVLQGIRDGTVVGTIVQNPYMYGYRSIEILNQLHKGDTSVIPAGGFIDIPARVVLKEGGGDKYHGAEIVNSADFEQDLDSKLSGSGGDAGEGNVAAGERARFAFVTNGVADFWTIGKAGADQAARDFNVEVTTIMPSGITDQTRKIEDLLARGTDGIAISPINPDNQGDALNDAATRVPLITHDSDAPDSDRLVYVGMDNYEAGYLCGLLTRDAIPAGGKVMLFIGRLDQDNAKRRRQGCIDGIFGRPKDPTRSDPVGEVIVSEDGKYQILGTLTDNFDRAKAKANAEDALTRNPDLAAMVGLFEYNPPLIMEALERIGRLRAE